MSFSSISVRGKPLAQGRLPAVCAPLVARTHDELLAQAAAVVAKAPDLVEWRVDFFGEVASTPAVLAAARALRGAAGAIPILFTRRSAREGGEKIALDEDSVLALYRVVCESGCVDLADYEMDSDEARLREVRGFTRAAGVGLVLSFHDFAKTPAPDAIVARFVQAERLGGDCGKVAVMPQSPEDVLALLQATLRASREVRMPVAGMAMGALGAATRLVGGVFGSALTFAVAGESSAPGQVPIEDVRAVLKVLRLTNRA